MHIVNKDTYIGDIEIRGTYCNFLTFHTLFALLAPCMYESGHGHLQRRNYWITADIIHSTEVPQPPLVY